MFTPEGWLRHPWGFHISISWHQNDWLIQVGVQTIVFWSSWEMCSGFLKVNFLPAVHIWRKTRLLPFYLTFKKLQTNTSILFQQLCRVTLLPNFSLIDNVTLLSFRFSVFFPSFPNFLLLLPYQPQLSYAIHRPLVPAAGKHCKKLTKRSWKTKRPHARNAGWLSLTGWISREEQGRTQIISCFAVWGRCRRTRSRKGSHFVIDPEIFLFINTGLNVKELLIKVRIK